MQFFWSSHYEAVSILLLFVPFALITILYFFLRNLRLSHRYTLMLFFGWIILFLDVQLLSWFAFYYAPTDTMKEEITLHDGASGVFVLLFGWSVPLVLTIILDFVHVLYHKGKKAG